MNPKIPICFVHTSPAAIPPLMQFYGEHAPEFEITNLLDDGILRWFRSGDQDRAADRLAGMLEDARGRYESRAVLLTCSAVSRAMVGKLEGLAGIPVVKIDDAMAEQAVLAGRRIGVALTFGPTRPVTEALLLDTAQRLGRTVSLSFEECPGAYDALLGGDAATHDRSVADAVDRLAAENDLVVLAQVSMARVLPALSQVGVPVLSSPPASLEAIRKRL